MTTPVTFKNQKVYQAEVLINDISNNPNNNVYLTIHKTTEWANEAAPPVANSNYRTIFDLWDQMIMGKKITGNDIYHAIPRYDWTANTVYAECDQDVDYSNSQFYVITSDYNVYKCISNNSGSLSTVEPTSLLTTTISETADNYKWKYMYTLSDTEIERFLTAAYVPVKTLTYDDFSLQWDVQQNALPGAIYHINVESGGSAYTNNDTLTVTITGDGSGANATANINTLSNTVHTITMDSYGAGYTYANAFVSGGGGTGATIKPLISPPEGHGSNPKYELNGHYIIFDMRINGTESDTIIANNDYRQISMVLNPKIYGSSNIMSNSVFSQYTTLQLSSTGYDYQNDEYVYIGASIPTASFTGIVLNWDSSNSKIHLINTKGTPTSDILNGANSAAARFVTSDITYPQCAPATGRVLYVENIEAIDRAPDQTEEFRIILRL